MPNNSENYLFEAIYVAKLREIEDRFIRQGFRVVSPTIGGTNKFDLLLQDERGKKIGFEVIVGDLSKSKEKIEGLTAAADRLGIELRVVQVVPPMRNVIEVPWLESALLDYLINNVPDEIFSLGNTRIEEVAFDILGIQIKSGEIQAKVSGSIGFILEAGGRTDSWEHEDSFDFDGWVDLDVESEKITSSRISVDDSKFYE